MLGRSLDLEVRYTAGQKDHVHGSTFLKFHYIGKRPWISLSKARLMISLALRWISPERRRDGDHLPHSVEYPASKAKAPFSRQAQLVCNERYIEWSPNIIVMMERTIVDTLGLLDFRERRSWRSSYSPAISSSVPSGLYACLLVAIFANFETSSRSANFVAHGIVNARGWDVLFDWRSKWLRSTSVNHVLHSFGPVSHVLCPRNSLVTQRSLGVPAPEWLDSYVAHMKIFGNLHCDYLVGLGASKSEYYASTSCRSD